MPVNSKFPNADRILLTDADESDSLNLASFLELSGFTVKRTGDMTEALTEFARFSPGIVIIDSNLPSKTWLELIQSIRRYEEQKDSDYRSIVIVTASRYTTDLHQRAAKAGAHEVIGKPIAEAALLKKISEHTQLY